MFPTQSQNQGYQGQKFQETLSHEVRILDQMRVCQNAFTGGDPVEAMNAVEALLLLVTPSMVDDQYLLELEACDEEWRTEAKKRKRTYEANLRAARWGCPDLVEKPSLKPGLDHWKTKYMVALGLFDRKGLMLKANVEDTL